MKHQAWAGALALLLGLSATAATAETALVDVLRASFKPKNQATLERLDQDRTQQACSTGRPVSGEAAVQIIMDSRDTIRDPADGRYLGDWKAGEIVAQNGRGKQYSDDPAEPSGGNCYACHQLAQAEVAYGTIGPSLMHYGKLRGRDAAILKYTWGKIYNAQAFMPCSLMPRFGHQQILDEQQMRDVMAYLFDPESPVNQ